MTSERWRNIEELYHAAQERARADRGAFLADACAGDDELRREVEVLLAQDSDGHILDGAAAKLLAPAAGDRLGHYEIVGLIGAGGMGEVYKARDPRLRRNVAVKVLPAEVSRDAARRQRFEREARAVAALNHPNIVAVYDVGEDRGVFFIVTELVDGETLRVAGLSLRKALDIAVQIASGLDAAHQAGVVHRDLKPANILLAHDGRVKILDFGLAKVAPVRSGQTAEMETHPGVVMGTPGYMSPEQVKGEVTDHRSDIFSFGLILYELLAGQRAFHGSAVETMAAIVQSDPPELAETVPSGARQIVAHCLEKDSAKRFQSVRDLSFALSTLSQTSGPIAAVAAPKRPVAWIALGAVALIAVSIIVVRWLWPSAAPPLHATVLTSFVGHQGEPSISPDGNQFAFTWDGDVPNGNPHVYISLVGKGTPLRLTPENEAAWGPAWSPDGQSIAFLRPGGSQESEIHVMPALGGPSRRIASGLTRRRGPNAADAPFWSPDSKWLLWSQITTLGTLRNFIQAAPAGGGDTHGLLNPPASGTTMRGHSPAISPDGREMVWVRCETNDCDLFLAGFQDGQSSGTPRRLTNDHKRKRNPLWTKDGREIVYIGGEPTSELSMYRVRASGGEPRRIEGIGANATYMTLATKSNRLLYSTASTNVDIQRVDLNSADARPDRFLSSTRYEGSPTYSPDGKRIAFSSNRVGVRQIWVADADGANLSPLTSFPDGIADYPKWSPDGQFIAFDADPEGNADIYTVPGGGGPVKRLTSHRGTYHNPTWSLDGKWIYFTSILGGGSEIYRMRPDGSAVQQITHSGAYDATVSPDGKWLYYMASFKLWKVPVGGGETSQVLALAPMLSEVRAPMLSEVSFAVTARGIYAVGAHQPEGYPVVIYPFDGGKPRTLLSLSRPPNGRPEISPDGRWLLYTSADDPTYEIMLVENFR